MSGDKHSPEPWKTLAEYGCQWAFEAADGTHVGQVDQVAPVSVSPKQVLRTANVRRIIACVNACAGLDSGGLSTGSLADALQALAVLVDDGEPAAARRLAIGQARHALRALGRLP